MKQKQLDFLIAGVFFVVFFAFYSYFGMRLSEGVYFEYLNLGFDFDPPYFTEYLIGEVSVNVNYKHPLAMLFRPFSQFFLLLGFQPKEASALVMSLFGGMTVALIYGFCRSAGFGMPEAIGSSLFYGVTATSIFTAIIVESYGWASFTIVLIWSVFLYSVKKKNQSFHFRLIAAVLASGVTITNAIQSIVAEFFLWLEVDTLKQSLIRAIFFGLVVGFTLALILVLLQPKGMWNIITQPIQTAKEVYWLRTKGDTVGILDLLKTYFGYSFFAPKFTQVMISSAAVMVDFRHFSYEAGEKVVLYLWWMFVTIGCWASFVNHAYRRIAIPLMTVLIFNILFHLDYQYRGSIYLYAAHLHFSIFALSCGAGPWVSTRQWYVRLGFFSALMALVVAALIINGQRAGEFSRMFDSLPFPSNDPAILRH